MQRTTTEIWTYRVGIDPGISPDAVMGYAVEARDGGIGKVDEATLDAGAACIVVDTGPWIFGKKVLLPAGVIDRIDSADEKIYVSRTKDEIKNAPEFDADRYRDEAYRAELGGYYGTRAETYDRPL